MTLVAFMAHTAGLISTLRASRSQHGGTRLRVLAAWSQTRRQCYRSEPRNLHPSAGRLRQVVAHELIDAVALPSTGTLKPVHPFEENLKIPRRPYEYRPRTNDGNVEAGSDELPANPFRLKPCFAVASAIGGVSSVTDWTGGAETALTTDNLVTPGLCGLEKMRVPATLPIRRDGGPWPAAPGRHCDG